MIQVELRLGQKQLLQYQHFVSYFETSGSLNYYHQTFGSFHSLYFCRFSKSESAVQMAQFVF